MNRYVVIENTGQVVAKLKEGAVQEPEEGILVVESTLDIKFDEFDCWRWSKKRGFVLDEPRLELMRMRINIIRWHREVIIPAKAPDQLTPAERLLFSCDPIPDKEWADLFRAWDSAGRPVMP